MGSESLLQNSPSALSASLSPFCSWPVRAAQGWLDRELDTHLWLTHPEFPLCKKTHWRPPLSKSQPLSSGRGVWECRGGPDSVKRPVQFRGVFELFHFRQIDLLGQFRGNFIFQWCRFSFSKRSCIDETLMCHRLVTFCVWSRVSHNTIQKIPLCYIWGNHITIHKG